MPNIKIKRINDAIRVHFGDYFESSEHVNHIETIYQKTNIERLGNAGTHVSVKFTDGTEWKAGITQEIDNFVIDSVQGTEPTSIDNLFELISSVME